MITCNFDSENPNRLRAIVRSVQGTLKSEDARNIVVQAAVTGISVWEGDSDPDAYSVLEEIIDYAEACGGRVIRLTSSDVIELTNCRNDQRHELHGEGTFALLNDL